MTQESAERPARVQFAIDALRTLHRAALISPRLREPRDEDGERFLARYERLLDDLGNAAPDYEHEGRELMASIQLSYPELWEQLDRDLLWFFGGDCLHFLTDEEIAAFQAQEDDAC